ncbi:MAG: O-antigen ligase family protein [Actinobacteria bacterium]|nr:O-antigen ligase family protein [Actinomycetota bacterium]
MFAPLTLYVVIIDFFRDSRALGNALKWLFISGVIYSLVATVYFNFVPSDEWNNDAIKVRYMLTDVTDTRALKEFKNIHGFGYGNYAVRETLPGIAEPAFGVMLAPLILIGFYYAMNSSGLLKFFYFVSSFFMFYTLTNTLARSSFVAFMIGLVLFLWLIREKKKDVLIILLAITTILLTNKPMQYRFIQLIGAVVQEAVKKPPVVQEAVKKMEKKVYFSNDGHIDSIFETYKNFKKAPFLGNGISYMESKYKDNRWYAEHNRYLYMLSTAGLLTVIPYAGFILSLILISLKTLINKLRTNKKLSDIGSGLVLCPSVLLFAIQINNAGMETYYYWIFFGLAAAWIRNSKSEDRNENSVN